MGRIVHGRKHEVAEERHGRIQLLATIADFSRCSDAELRRIDDLGTEIRRPAGAVLVRADAPLRQAVLVLDGVVAERPAVGHERTVSTGSLLGAEALQRFGAMPSAGAVAQTDVTVLVFGRYELDEIATLDGVRDGRRAPAARQVTVSERRLFLPAWGAHRVALG